jgi:hypothetical protein
MQAQMSQGKEEELTILECAEEHIDLSIGIIITEVSCNPNMWHCVQTQHNYCLV